MKLLKGITAWSFSRWQDYVKCPLLAKFKHVDRLKEPENAALLRGGATHKKAEQYTIGALQDLPVELGKFSDQFKALQRSKALCEQEWSFTQSWQKTGWFAPDAWLRIKMDVHYLDVVKNDAGINETTIVVIDHKTGKQHAEHAQQRSIYALGAMLVYPDAIGVTVKHWYLDHGTEATDTFKADELPRLKQEWLDRSRAMLHDTRFAPTPGPACRWCYFRRSNSGPCQFG